MTISTPIAQVLVKQALMTENPEVFIAGIITTCKTDGTERKNLEDYLNEGHGIDMTKVNEILETIKVSGI